MNEQNSTFTISLEQFEGPLDLLYQLIEKRKLQINTISLAKITNDYLYHIQKNTLVTVEEIAKFVHVASILVLIKSKSLLPILEYTKEEEVDVLLLEERMKLFNFVRKYVVPALDTWSGIPPQFSRPKKQSDDVLFSPDASCTVTGVHSNARTVIAELSFFKEPPKKKVRKVVSIEAVVERVLRTVKDRIAVSFTGVVAGREKQEQIVSFLAVLELMRENLLCAKQDREFDDILLSKQETSNV